MERGEEADQLLATIRSLLSDLGEPSVEIDLESDLVDELGLDSLSLLELLERVEGAFGVSIDERTLTDARTVGDWLDALAGAGAAAPSQLAAAVAPPQPPPVAVMGEPPSFPPTAHGPLGVAYGWFAWAAAVACGSVAFALVLLPVPLRWRWNVVRSLIDLLRLVLRIPLTVEGRIGDGSPAVFVANHGSFLDGFAVISASAAPVAFVTSTEIGAVPLVGRFLRRIGCVVVQRGRADESVAAVAQMAGPLADRSLFVFPEGGLVGSGSVAPFRLGAFRVATELGVPIVPVGIEGSRAMLPRGARLPRRGRLTVRVGDPLLPMGREFAAQVDLRDRARAAVAGLAPST